MSIQEIFSNFKHFFSSKDTGISLIMVAVGVGSFLLGSHMPMAENTENLGTAIFHIPKPSEKAEVVQTHESTTSRGATTLSAPISAEKEASKPAPSSGAYVGSKSGDKYHLPWCAGAKRIKEENKVWFATKEEAEAKGYSPASNCKGI